MAVVALLPGGAALVVAVVVSSEEKLGHCGEVRQRGKPFRHWDFLLESQEDLDWESQEEHR